MVLTETAHRPVLAARHDATEPAPRRPLTPDGRRGVQVLGVCLGVVLLVTVPMVLRSVSQDGIAILLPYLLIFATGASAFALFRWQEHRHRRMDPPPQPPSTVRIATCFALAATGIAASNWLWRRHEPVPETLLVAFAVCLPFAAAAIWLDARMAPRTH